MKYIMSETNIFPNPTAALIPKTLPKNILVIIGINVSATAYIPASTMRENLSIL